MTRKEEEERKERKKHNKENKRKCENKGVKKPTRKGLTRKGMKESKKRKARMSKRITNELKEAYKEQGEGR